MTIARPPLRHVLACLATALPLLGLGLALPAGAAVVISQVYGGGGNSGATLTHDFVELHNTGNTTVSLAGMTLQYASATAAGFSAGSSPLALSGSIGPGGYFLIQLAKGTGGTQALPTPDFAPTSNVLALGGGAGKLVLVQGAAISGCPAAGTVLDLVAYGSTALCFEGGGPAPGTSNSQSVLRDAAGGGCADSNSNSADFSAVTAAPRNSASTPLVCGSGGGGTPPPEPLALSIPQIQGSGTASAYLGQAVRTTGVVTRTTNNGFFLQALTGDSNDATSDGLYVFQAGTPTVVAGQLVQVVGTVAEFATAGSTVTQLTSPTTTVQGTGYSVAPMPITLPVAGGLERLEGMLVTLAGPLTVGQNYFQARFGQLTLSAGGRLETPTNRHRPGDQAQALAAANAARSIVLEDGSSLQNLNPTAFTGPTGALRGGDSIGTITGVIDYGPATSDGAGLGSWRIVPVQNNSLGYSSTHPRPTTVPAAVGNVTVGSFNVLNYFTTFTNGATADGQTGQTCVAGQTATASCRGASNLAEFQRQQAKIVAALSLMDADVLGLMEIQNNTVAAQNLAAALNTQLGAGTYAVAPGPAADVVGSDAIKTTILYKPARLAPVGDSVVDLDAVNNRPTVAQTFAAANGVRFTLAVNHFKSKGSCPAVGDPDHTANRDTGDGQGCWNAVRTAQAHRLRSFVSQLQTSSGSNDVVLVGDLNAYAQEDPVHALTSSGYVDQIGRFNSFGYSYVFDGAAGRLDHAITTATASAKVGSAVHWHINADESPAHDYNLEFKQPACTACAPDPYQALPYRSSDHDPVLLGLNLYNSYITASGSVVVGTSGDDLITSGLGRRSLSGGAGRDQFAFAADFTGGATITDFSPGQDLINLRAVLQALRIGVADPLASGHLSCVASGPTDALISVDPDAGGPAARRGLILLRNLPCHSIGRASYLF